MDIELPAQHTTHICIVDNDPASNLTPIVDNTIPSHHLILAYVPQNESSYIAIATVARSRGYKVTAWLLPTNVNTEQLTVSFQQLFEQYRQSEERLWLNGSSGSSQQLIAACDAAKSNKVPIYLVELKKAQLQWLSPTFTPATYISEKLTIQEFVSLYGSAIVCESEQPLGSDYQEIAKDWTTNALELQAALCKLNRLSHSASNHELVSASIDISSRQNPKLQYLLHSLAQNGLVTVKNNCVQFTTEISRQFCLGGWLKYSVFSKLQTLRSALPQLQDLAYDVTLQFPEKAQGEPVQGSFDVVTLCNNHLHFIEVKTERFKSGEVAQVLMRLSGLSESFGTKSRSALISYYPLKASEKLRANQLNITVIDGSQIPFVGSLLREWLEQV